MIPNRILPLLMRQQQYAMLLAAPHPSVQSPCSGQRQQSVVVRNQCNRLHWLVTLIPPLLFAMASCDCDTILLINRVSGELVCTGTDAWKGCQQSLPRSSYRRYSNLPLCGGRACHFAFQSTAIVWQSIVVQWCTSFYGYIGIGRNVVDNNGKVVV